MEKQPLKSEPPALDYAEIAALLPKPQPPIINYAEIAALLHDHE